MKNHTSSIPVDVYVSTPSPKTVSVTVSAPKYKHKDKSTFSITKGQIKRLKMDWQLRNFGSVKSNKAVHVEADSDVVVYGVNKQSHCTDGFLAFPTDVLGTRHFAATFNNKKNSKYMNNILVTGVHDRTSLSIRLADDPNIRVRFERKNYRNGQWINKTINRFDTLQIETLGDLSGSLIESSHPVAVQSGNKKSIVRTDNSDIGIDHIVEQIPPVNTWGQKFITYRIPGRRVDNIIKIIASKDSTTVRITACGNNSTFHFNMGDFREVYTAANCHAYIYSSQAVLVVQFVQSVRLNKPHFPQETDPAMFMVPPVEQYAADYIISLPNATDGFFSNYFLIIIKESDKMDLLIDEKQITRTQINNFTSIQGTNFVGGYIFVGKDSDVHTLRHKWHRSTFGAVAYGGESYESYAFPVGLRMLPINSGVRNFKKVRTGLYYRF